MSDFEELLRLYNYNIPEDAIALAPASPRDSAKLLIYNRKADVVAFDTFLHLDRYLPKHAVLVMNQTKVLPARLHLKKPTGGDVQILYIATEGAHIKVMVNRHLSPGDVLTLNAKIHFTVQQHIDKYYLLDPSFPLTKLFGVLERYGTTPIPPYIKHSPLSEQELKEKYQTVFAKERGSVAAPTASLHFTKRLLSTLRRSGIQTAFVTLHVNLGTFAPLTEEHVRTGKLHAEWYEIDPTTARMLNAAKKTGRPIVAVGTTVVRTLESASGHRRTLNKLRGTTDLFLKEGDRLHFVDSLITNFHVPKSSLLMLVSAFVPRKKLLKLYELALKKRFRFFSFGDGMLIL